MTASRVASAALIVIMVAACGAAPAPSLDPPTTAPTTTAPTMAAPPTESNATSTPTVTVSATPSPTPTASARKKPGPKILIDPGHSGKSIRSTDSRTGLRDIDYPNYPELYEMFDVSTCVAKGLRTDGYRVWLTKKKAGSSVGLAARARQADRLKVALAISVHDDHSQTASFQATYSQRGVKKNGRYPTMYRGKGSHRTTFRLPKIAKASQKAAKIIAKARASAQQRKVSVRQNSFTGRPPLEPGNLALVQLLTKRPWVYNELGAKTRGSTTRAISISAELGYAKGLLTGIERVVPISGSVLRQPSAGARGLRSCLVTQVRQSRPTKYLPDGWS